MSYTNQHDSTDIGVENGMIRFNGYLSYKNKAEQARNFLMSLDVTPESEKDCKAVVASARKIEDQLNQEKIRIKKEILAPYMKFEEQVKEIIGIITEGENVARDKLKAIDDRRREEKKEEIRKIWNARCGSFECGKYITFEQFLQDKHLNKTVPISTVEKEMVQFLVEKTKEINYLNKMAMRDEYMVEYLKTLNLEQALDTVESRHLEMILLSEDQYMVIRISGKANIRLAKQVLDDIIDYEILEESKNGTH